MKVCYWCEVKEGTIFRQYPIESGHYCLKCTKKLDKWSRDDWEKFYEDLGEANTSDLIYHDDSTYQKFKDEIERNSSARICIICGVNRSRINCNCND